MKDIENNDNAKKNLYEWYAGRYGNILKSITDV
jgi:hypothetical protein